MRPHRLYCGKCGARESVVEIVNKVPKAKCLKCGAEIPMIRNAYGKYSPKPVARVES